MSPAPKRRQCGTQQAHERRSEEHTSELQSQSNLVCRLLLEKKKTQLARVSGGIPPHTRHPQDQRTNPRFNHTTTVITNAGRYLHKPASAARGHAPTERGVSS